MEAAMQGRLLARAAIAAVLIYVLLAKAFLAPLGLGHAAAGAEPFAQIICAHDDAGGAPAPVAPAEDGSCCDEGCLPRLLAYAAPVASLATIVVLVGVPVAKPSQPRPALSLGKTSRIAARPSAQRAPPLGV